MPFSFLSFSLCCTHYLNGNYLHLRQFSGASLISYLLLFHLFPLYTQTQIAPQPFLYFFPPLPSLQEVVLWSPYSNGCVILYEPIDLLGLQARQEGIVRKCLQPWKEFVQTWLY